MADEHGDFRSWLADALARRVRHPALEETLFHQLTELERGPLEQLNRLVRMVIDELAAARRRIADQGSELRALQDTVATLTARVDALAFASVEPPAAPAGYLLLLPTPEGYRLVERDGAPPGAGAVVEHEGARYRLLPAAHAPLPGDRRPSLLALEE